MAVAKAAIVTEPPKWLIGWFVLSSLIVCWDTGYIFARPHSFAGGKWHWIWKPYALYGDVDLIYSRRFYELHNGFTAAQAAMNVVETLCNFAYVWMAAVQPNARLRAIAPLVGFSAALMTLWKTILYWLQDYLSGPNGWGYTGHNTPYNFFVLFVIPNGFWILIPLVAIAYLGPQISEMLITAAGLAGPAGGTRSRTRKSITSGTTRRKSITKSS